MGRDYCANCGRVGCDGDCDDDVKNFRVNVQYVPLTDIIGKTIKNVIVSNNKDEIIFVFTDDSEYMMFHYQDCCETVLIEDIDVDLKEFIGAEVYDFKEEKNNQVSDAFLTQKWTFYHFKTSKGSATIRWYGKSNGYYSVSVSFGKLA